MIYLLRSLTSPRLFSSSQGKLWGPLLASPLLLISQQMFGRPKRHSRPPPSCHSCHSFSPFLITSEFSSFYPRSRKLKNWRSRCHASRRPAGIIPPFLHSANLRSLLMKLWIHIHALIAEPYLLLIDVALVRRQSNIASFFFSLPHPSIFPFSPGKDQFTLSSFHPPLLALSFLLFLQSQPESPHLLHFVVASLLSVCSRKGTKEERGNHKETNRWYNQQNAIKRGW